MTTEIRVLGPVEIITGTNIERPRGRQVALLAELVAAFPDPVSTGRLEEVLWGDHPPQNIDTALHIAVSRLRKRLGDGSIQRNGSAYSLEWRPDQIDVVVFGELAERARERWTAGDVAGALEAASSGLELWRGDPFATVGDRLPLEATNHRLDELRHDLVELRIDALLASDRTTEAVLAASEATTDTPLRERRWEQLMLALHRSGRTAEALRVFRQYREMLAEELGLSPGPSIAATEVALLNGDDVAVSPNLGSTAPHPDPLRPHRELNAPTTSYVERPEASAALDEALSHARWVTLAGAPGIGKTRLVRDHTLALDRDRLWWLDLRNESPDTVTAAVADRFGLSEPPGLTQLAEAVAGQIGRTPAMLVLDDCDHVADRVTEVVEALLEGCPSLTVAATARAPFGSPAEHVVRLGPMAEDEAARLLSNRVDPALRLQPHDLRRLAETHDFVPLALELAATRLRTHTVAEVIQAAGGDGHRAFTSGVELLDAADRARFASLGVMPGAFDPGAASAVSGADTESMRRTLDHLVEASLVQMIPGHATPLYRLLQPMQDVARTELAATGREVECADRHLSHHVRRALDHAEQLTTDREERAVAEVESLVPHVRAAFEVARASGQLDELSTLAIAWWPEALRSLRHRDFSWPSIAVNELEAAGREPDEQLLAAASMAEWSRGRVAPAIRMGERSLEASETKGRPVALDARFGLIAAYGFRDRHEAAHQQLMALLREARALGDHYRWAGALTQIAFGYTLVGFRDEARTAADKGLAVAEDSDNTSTLAFAHHGVGLTWFEDDPQRALQHVVESLRLSTRVDNRWLTGWTMSTLAGVCRRVGRFDEAARTLGRLLSHWRAASMEPQLMHSLLEAALLFDQIGDTPHRDMALGVAGLGRRHHPLMPSDAARVDALRNEVAILPPMGSEADAIEALRARLETI